MIRKLLRVFVLIAVVFPCGHNAFGQSIMVGPDKKFEKQVLSLPYAFYNENFGFAGAYVYAVTGYPQKQAALISTAMAGTNGSAMTFLMGRDLQMPLFDRWFLDAIVQAGYFRDADIYTDGNPHYANERAGSNNSDQNDYVTSDGGWDNFFRLRFKYLLPMGHGRDTIITTQVVDRGMLADGATGGQSWNPFTSGLTYLELQPFYRLQQIHDRNYLRKKVKTNGLMVSLFRDNRDFRFNPSKGSAIRLKYRRDFGWFNSSESYTAVDTEMTKYFSLGESDWFRQRVLAFDFWTAYSPTWNQKDNGDIEHRPPTFAGATLGGLWRLRGYPSQRFSDKAAIYYAAEYRMIPRWNPFENWDWLQKYVGVQWLQFVPFVEVGRVAPDWGVQRLNRDMKWDAGVGLRLWAKGIVVRIDSAVSDEGYGVQMMVAQPFQF
ncbi:MAG: BamA/TamA family outer membrane protein [Deltaproteobacteria bacterium]|nr:BamA/TamA family outer membrane protein [Deltaproteobacteria bacterium]